MKLTFVLLFALSWLDAGRLPVHTPPRPKPIEPDASTDGGNLRAEPIWTWKPDSEGFYWVQKPDGSFAGDRNKAIVSPHGKPVNLNR